MRVREGRRVREDRNSAVWWAASGGLGRCGLFGEARIVLRMPVRQKIVPLICLNGGVWS